MLCWMKSNFCPCEHCAGLKLEQQQQQQWEQLHQLESHLRMLSRVALLLYAVWSCKGRGNNYNCRVAAVSSMKRLSQAETQLRCVDAALSSGATQWLWNAGCEIYAAEWMKKWMIRRCWRRGWRSSIRSSLIAQSLNLNLKLRSDLPNSPLATARHNCLELKLLLVKAANCDSKAQVTTSSRDEIIRAPPLDKSAIQAKSETVQLQ